MKSGASNNLSEPSIDALCTRSTAHQRGPEVLAQVTRPPAQMSRIAQTEKLPPLAHRRRERSGFQHSPVLRRPSLKFAQALRSQRDTGSVGRGRVNAEPCP